jgi:hypothetical protein
VTPYPIILTTAEASLGHDLVPLAYVIQTELPQSFSTFVQNAGRGNRIDPTSTFLGAFITIEPIFDVDALKQGCEYEQSRAKLFRPDYHICLEMLECCANINSEAAAFKNSFKIFNENGTAAAVRTALSTKAPSFVKALKDLDATLF